MFLFSFLALTTRRFFTPVDLKDCVQVPSFVERQTAAECRMTLKFSD